jgi:hypothetical protein
VKLVDEDTDQSLYREATKGRAENIDVYSAAVKTTFRDDREFGVSIEEISPAQLSAQIEKSRVA